MEKEEMVAIDKFLGILMNKSYTCKKCAFKREPRGCFFASDCFPNYKWFKEKEKTT